MTDDESTTKTVKVPIIDDLLPVKPIVWDDEDASLTAPAAPDIPRLRQMLRQITTYPEKWEQGTWGELSTEAADEVGSLDEEHKDLLGRDTPCGSAFCAAGWGAILNGAEVRWSGPELDSVRDVGASDWLFAADYGQVLFGLSHPQSSQFFAGSNSLKTLQEMVDALEADPKISGSALNIIAMNNGDRS